MKLVSQILDVTKKLNMANEETAALQKLKSRRLVTLEVSVEMDEDVEASIEYLVSLIRCIKTQDSQYYVKQITAILESGPLDFENQLQNAVLSIKDKEK